MANMIFVRATFTDGSNVPRIPPQRVGAGLFYRDVNWFARVGLLHAFAQNDVSGFETTTDGYDLLKAELSYTAKLRQDATGITEYKVGIVGDNLLNDDIRNAVSFKKDEVLQPGRTVRSLAASGSDGVVVRRASQQTSCAPGYGRDCRRRASAENPAVFNSLTISSSL